MNKTCQDKIPFPTEEDAEGAKVMAQNNYDLDSKLTTYQCSKCDLWHLASKSED